MDFITGAFLLFFTICVAVYYSIPKKGQWIWLLLCSIFFYLCASVKLSIFILFSIISSFVAARRLEQLCAREQAVREKTDPDQKKETDVNVHKKAVAALLIGSNAGLIVSSEICIVRKFLCNKTASGQACPFCCRWEFPFIRCRSLPMW